MKGDKMMEKRGEWGGYTVRQGQTGWIVESWSRVQGDVDGRKVVVPYRIVERQDPEARWNDHTTVGEYVYERSREIEGCRILRWGHVVA